MRVVGRSALSRLAGIFMLDLRGFLVAAWQEEAFDTVCKTISESLALKFKYQDVVCLCGEARNPLSQMIEVPFPKSTEAQPHFPLSLLLCRSGDRMGLPCNKMPLVGNFQKSPGNKGRGRRSRWESYTALFFFFFNIFSLWGVF